MLRLIFLFFLFLTAISFSQEADSILNNQNLPEQISQQNSIVSDTAKKSGSFGVDAIIYATGTDSLIFDIKNKDMKIYGSGDLKYKQTELKSHNINVDFETSQIQAFGYYDSSDTATTRYKQTPVLSEAGETYEGNSLRYNFKTQRGFISLAKNSEESNYYAGEKVKKVNKDTYFIDNGIYTTCNVDTPHYHFFADKMKVIIKQQIVAKWVFLHIGGVPLPLPLPFGVFPNKTGRRSGIIAPAYGERRDYGQYLSHFGFFWAINDYMDVNAMTDIFFKGGYSLNSNFRYQKRYLLNGNLELGYSNLHTGERGDPDYNQTTAWKLGLTHHQDLNPTTRIDANIRFQSSDFNRINSVSYNDLLAQNIYSSATLFKSWEGSGTSLSLNYERNQELDSTGDFTEILPSMNLTKSQFYPFRRDKKIDPKDQKWYELIGVNYGGQFRNRRVQENGNLQTRAGVQHNLSSSFSPKVGYFNLTPRISYSEKWYNKRTEINPVRILDTLRSTPGNPVYRDSLVYNDVNEINMVRNFDMGIAASTRLFGIIQPNMLGIEAFRHTLTPTISYTYQPDFTSDTWGYYDEYINAQGEIIRYDKFSREVFGGGGSGERQSINFSIQNVFEIKTKKDPTDTTSEAKKIQLLNFEAGTSYNFAAPTNKLSDLNLGFRTQISNILNFSGSAIYSFYQFDPERQRASENYLLETSNRLMRLRNFSFNISTSLSESTFKRAKKEEENISNEENEFESGSEYVALYKEEPPDFSIPWDLSLNLNYSQNKENVVTNFGNKTVNMSASLNFSLTQSTKFSFTGNYDIISKQLSAPSVRIYKDLHCWEASINWNPIGAYRGYRFEIRIKAPQLQDLKVERSRGQFSGRY